MALEQNGTKLNKLWNRRQTTKFNGVPYLVQKGAAAVFSEEGQNQIKENRITSYNVCYTKLLRKNCS